MIQLSHTISPDRNTLTLHANEAARQELRELRNESPDWGCSTMEFEVCEHLTANSELQWLNPADTMDLTDAPILGILGEEQTEESGPYGCIHTSGGPGSICLFQPILERWGFEPYQVRSFLDDLLEQGEAKFINTW